MNRTRFGTLLLVTLLAAGFVPAQEPSSFSNSSAEPGSSANRARLDSIRDDLVALRFEKALAAIGALLGDPSLAESGRAEAWILRAQAHVALGDLNGAEADYREILRIQPGYVPESSLITPKAKARYDKVHKELIGTLILSLEPADATVRIDGREVVPGSEGATPVLAGNRRLDLTRSGHDPIRREIVVEPGQIQVVNLQLVPNSRTVVVTTDVPGVAIWLDGVEVGKTEPAAEPGALPVPTLVLRDLPLGEHTYNYVKDCYRTEQIRGILNVDLLDRSPYRLDTIRMQPTRSTLVVEGEPAGAEVRVDGELVGQLPMEPLETCPATREVVVTYAGRTIWKSEERFLESSAAELRVRPRPNLALLGAADLPPNLLFLGTRFNIFADAEAQVSEALEQADTWRTMRLAPNADVALAIVPAGRAGTRDRWYLYSPILRRVVRLDAAPDGADRPPWSRPVWGLNTVDSERGGVGRVAEVLPGGAAAAVGLVPGDRIQSLDGKAPLNSGALRERLLNLRADQAQLEWADLSGKTKSAALQAGRSPHLIADKPKLDVAIFRAAWAVVDSLSGDDVPTALSNLALLFGAFDQPELAVETWRRVRWGKRPGIGEGTVQFYLGRELEKLDREAAAVEAYKKAAGSLATAVDDEGPAIAPAARDRLADLGVSFDG